MIHGNVCAKNLKNRNFGLAKAIGFNDLKWFAISNELSFRFRFVHYQRSFRRFASFFSREYRLRMLFSQKKNQTPPKTSVDSEQIEPKAQVNIQSFRTVEWQALSRISPKAMNLWEAA